MSKFGWDLPPGVSIRDIPGNRPQDEIAEAQVDKICDIVGVSISDAQVERLAKLLNEAFEMGYQQAVSDRAEADFWDSQPKEVK